MAFFAADINTGNKGVPSIHATCIDETAKRCTIARKKGTGERKMDFKNISKKFYSRLYTKKIGCIIRAENAERFLAPKSEVVRPRRSKVGW